MFNFLIKYLKYLKNMTPMKQVCIFIGIMLFFLNIANVFSWSNDIKGEYNCVALALGCAVPIIRNIRILLK